MRTTFTALLPLLGSAALDAQDSKPMPVVLGEGAHRFEWDATWPQLPADLKLGNTHGAIVITKAGDVLFNTDSDHAIVVIGKDGKLQRVWGKEYRGGLHGMCLVEEDGKEVLYLAHTTRHSVFKVELDGKVLWTLGYPKASGVYTKESEFNPTAIVVAPDGRFFVADGYGKSWVHQYDKDANYVRSFGGPGTEPGKMRCPHGLWIDRRGKEPTLLVADRENHRLQRFDLDGKLLAVLPVELRRPCGMHEIGSELVIADLAGRITLLDKDDQLIAHLGDNPDPKKRAQNGVPPAQWKDGEFIAPHCARIAGNGDVYVMDWNANGRMTRLKRIKSRRRAGAATR